MDNLDQALHPLPWQLGAAPPQLPVASALPLLLLLDCPSPLSPSQRTVLQASLCQQELQRHHTYRRQADQDRFLMGRASLRHLLGHWLGVPPAAVTIESGPHGKPHCPSPGAPSFNLSHSGELILLGFHTRLEVGVDVERARLERDWLPIARRVFPPGQLSALQSLPAAEQPDAFLRAWCQLEARLKARGMGLAGLERLPGAGAGDADGTLLWSVSVPSPYAAAVALQEAGAERGNDRLTGPPAAWAGAPHPSLPG